MASRAPVHNCHDNIGPTVLITAWTLAALTTIIVTIRIGTQTHVVKRVGLSDWLMLLALVFSIIAAALISHGVHWGFGRHFGCLSEEERAQSIRWALASEVPGILGTTFARISFCVYLLKLAGTSKSETWFLWATIGTQVFVNAFTIVEILVQCQHLASLWDPIHVKGHCWSPKVQAYIGFTQGAWNSLSDLLLTVLPILILKDLNMKMSTRVALASIMGLSIFAMVASIIKTVELKFIGERRDYTWDTVIFVIWSTVENYIVIITASIPTIRPLFLWIMRRRHPSQVTSGSQPGKTQRKHHFCQVWKDSTWSGSTFRSESDQQGRVAHSPCKLGMISKTTDFCVESQHWPSTAQELRDQDLALSCPFDPSVGGSNVLPLV